MTKNTPVRNNYAAPHTPITSVKRPRSSLERSNSAVRTPSMMKSPMPTSSSSTTTTTTTNHKSLRTPTTKKTTTKVPTEPSPPSPPPPPPPTATMSPMHPPRPVPKRDGDVETPPPAVSSSVEEEETTAAAAAESSASWVGRKVDALFSPVLSFLSSNSKDEADHHIANNLDEAAAVTDEDVTMEEVIAAHPQQQIYNIANNVANEEAEAEDEEEEPESEQENQTPEKHHPTHSDKNEVAEEEEEEEEDEEFNPYLFIKSLPQYVTVRHLRPPVALPPKDVNAPPVTLVLDLDETLVHCTVEPTLDADLTFPVTFHGMRYMVHVKLRPHLFEFLEKIRGKFEIVVFTASQRVYADELLNRIDPRGQYFHHRMFRESCLAVEGNFLKDLTVLGRDLSKAVLVDNSPHAFGYQVDNGIPIESWFDDPADTELLKLEKYLQTLHTAPDVRACVRESFQTFRKVAES